MCCRTAASRGRPSAPRSGESLHRAALLVVIATFVAAPVLVFSTVARSDAAQQSFKETPPIPSAVNLTLALDSIDTSTGTMHLRLDASPGPRLSPAGAVVFTSIGEIPTIPVAPNVETQEQDATTLFQKGDVSSYPFENYGSTIRLVAFEGTAPVVPTDNTRPKVALNVLGVSNLAGFNPTAQVELAKDGTATINLQIHRAVGIRAWVVVMMAIYWVVALGAVVVAFMVVRRKRQWDSGWLLWLGALIFALFALRTAAPGNPPTGTVLDYYAVFESVGIVVATLIVLIVHYVVQPPERLNMTPPP
jgi:hypothetical protein